MLRRSFIFALVLLPVAAFGHLQDFDHPRNKRVAFVDGKRVARFLDLIPGQIALFKDFGEHGEVLQIIKAEVSAVEPDPAHPGLAILTIDVIETILPAPVFI